GGGGAAAGGGRAEHGVGHRACAEDEAGEDGREASPADPRVVAQRGTERVHVREATLGVEGEATSQQALHRRGQRGEFGGIGPSFFAHGVEVDAPFGGRERAHAEPRFGEREAERILVGAGVDVAAEVLFGRHEAGGAEQVSGRGEGFASGDQRGGGVVGGAPRGREGFAMSYDQGRRGLGGA